MDSYKEAASATLTEDADSKDVACRIHEGSDSCADGKVGWVVPGAKRIKSPRNTRVPTWRVDRVVLLDGRVL